MKTISIELLFEKSRSCQHPLQAFVTDTDGILHKVKVFPSGRLVDLLTGKDNNDIGYEII